MNNYNKEELLREIESGKEYTFTYVDTLAIDSIGFRSPIKFELNGIRYHSVEHYMAVTKARLLEDYDTMNKLVRATDSTKIQRYITLVKSKELKGWETSKEDSIISLFAYLLEKDSALYEKVISLNGDVIVLADWKDTYWGTGLKPESKYNSNPRYWKGENRYGFLLTLIRNTIKSDM